MSDVLQELYDEFPEIEKKSIDKICKDGLTSMNKLFRAKEELMIKHNATQVKFFVPCSQERQNALAETNRNKRYYKALKKKDGETSN
jgi:hypothetical protein